VKLVPNPTGKDEEGEIVAIKNNSGKKVDIEGWKIATGPGKKMYNHPIDDKLSVNPGETKTITREFSKFSLNNKSGKIALVMPDGKTIDEVKYSKEKIAENEAYEKINGEWQWIASNTIETSENTNEETEFVDDPTGEIEIAEEENSGNNDEAGEVLGATDENITPFARDKSNFSSEDAFIFFSKIGFFPSATEINYCPIHQTSSLDLIIASLI
jgi:hypothetical protein